MPIETLKNTLVHELFHAMMDDYNRTGMSGATNLKDLKTDSSGHFPTQELDDRYLALQYPQWFIEGSASAVEGDYAFRNYTFQGLRRLQGKDGTYGTGDYNPTFTTKLLIDNYINARDIDGKFWYYDLMFAPGGTDSNNDEVEIEGPRYVTGYLATLYLCDLAVRYNHDNKVSSVKVVNGVTTVHALKLRDGLDSLLSWSHKGSTMDDIINALSPKDEKGQPIYKDTADFEKQFIKGTPDAKGAYDGDPESVTFVNTLLNYLLYLDNKLPEGSHPNGSILEDFSVYFTSLIDQSKKTSSECLVIINSNDMIPSTVKSDTANIGAGKSNPDKRRRRALPLTRLRPLPTQLLPSPRLDPLPTQLPLPPTTQLLPPRLDPLLPPSLGLPPRLPPPPRLKPLPTSKQGSRQPRNLLLKRPMAQTKLPPSRSANLTKPHLQPIRPRPWLSRPKLKPMGLQPLPARTRNP